MVPRTHEHSPFRKAIPPGERRPDSLWNAGQEACLGASEQPPHWSGAGPQEFGPQREGLAKSSPVAVEHTVMSALPCSGPT